MKFFVCSSYDNGSGCSYKSKEDILRELSLMIDDCIANGGTQFDITVDSDAPCYEPEEE